MDALTYQDEWGEEQEQRDELPRQLHTDAEVLGRLCRMLDDDPLAFFVWTQRILYRERTYEEISERLIELNPRRVTRQAIYDRIKNMINNDRGVVPAGLVMPRAKRKITVTATKRSFDRIRERYTTKRKEHTTA